MLFRLNWIFNSLWLHGLKLQSSAGCSVGLKQLSVSERQASPCQLGRGRICSCYQGFSPSPPPVVVGAVNGSMWVPQMAREGYVKHSFCLRWYLKAEVRHSPRTYDGVLWSFFLQQLYLLCKLFRFCSLSIDMLLRLSARLEVML